MTTFPSADLVENHLPTSVSIPAGSVTLPGILSLPPQPAGIVIFAHGSGSSRWSRRNRVVAEDLVRGGFGTLLFDLLTESEERDRTNVFDIALLAERLTHAGSWVASHPPCRGLPIGYFGASTGAAAALVAATDPTGPHISAVVSRGGRPDLAGDRLAHVQAPTLLIVGGADAEVLQLNRWALNQMPGTKQLVVIPGATHLFEEPGALDLVAMHALRWFRKHLAVEVARESI